MATHDSAARWNLGYATFSLAVGFAAWGLISAFASTFASQFGLSAQSTAFLVAVPVILGSLARLPIGVLTDWFGGRIVFTVLFLCVAISCWLVPLPSNVAIVIRNRLRRKFVGSQF